MGTFVDEFRGTDNLVYAEILVDDNESGAGHGFVTGAVKELAPVAEISKTVETSSNVKYYDNKAAIVIIAEGADTVTLTIPALDLPTLADITGKTFDPATGAFFDGERKTRYYAIGYRLKLTDGTYRYVWRYKGLFGIPDETSQTENNSTDSNNQQLTYTGIMTKHKFTKTGGSEKALVVDERTTDVNLDTFFSTVQTCDTFGGGSVAAIISSLSHVDSSNPITGISIGSAYSAVLTAEEGYEISNVAILMNGVDVTSTAYDSETGAITIASVTGNILISAAATASN